MSGSPDGSRPLSQELARDLERRVREAQNQGHSPAVSAGVVRDGTLVWSAHVGSARLDPGVPPITRDQEGEVSRMHFATYALTRAPTAFADLLD